MEKKVDLETLRAVLRDHVEDSKQAQILAEINQILIEETEVKKEKAPPIPKKQIVVITGGPEDWVQNKKLFEDLSGFITEIPEETHTGSLQEKIQNAKRDYSYSKKSKKNPAYSLGELFELAPTKMFKDNGILKKPKGPLEFIYIGNK
jgi:hypothetical protein